MSQRAAVMTDVESIELHNRPEPTPGPTEAVVRIEAVGVCGSDAAYFRWGYIGDYVVRGPIVLGHECAGQVVSVGTQVTNIAVGDRVAIEPGTPCRACHECMAGAYHLCADLIFMATPPHDGALQELVALDARCLFSLPESMTYEEGALLEPLSVGIWGCNRARLAPGDDVIVTGAGPVGLLAAAAAQALGAKSVTVTDKSDERLALAADLGFEPEHAETVHFRERTYDVLLECSGANGVLATGLERLRPHGRAAMIGIPKEDVVLPLARLNPRELSISTVHRYSHTWPIAMAMVASGRANVKPLITNHFPLNATAEALSLASSDPACIKAVVHPQQ